MKAWAGAVGLVGLVGILGSGTAMADGNELLTQCQGAVRYIETGELDGGMSAGYCFGIINGVINTMVTMNEYMLPKEKTCFPDDLKNEQGVRIVVRYLQSHPASLHRDGAFLAMAAFQNAYPCL